MFAILLALAGSFWFAAAMISINRGVLSIDYFRGLLANLSVNSLFLWLYIFLFVDTHRSMASGQQHLRCRRRFRSRRCPLFDFQKHGADRRDDLLLFDQCRAAFCHRHRHIVSWRTTYGEQYSWRHFHRRRNHRALMERGSQDLANPRSRLPARRRLALRDAG